MERAGSRFMFQFLVLTILAFTFVSNASQVALNEMRLNVLNREKVVIPVQYVPVKFLGVGRVGNNGLKLLCGDGSEIEITEEHPYMKFKFDNASVFCGAGVFAEVQFD